MTIDNLSIGDKKLLARKIRTFLEPTGASSANYCKEFDIRKFVRDETGLVVDGIADIISVLKLNYSDKTIKRLSSRFQHAVVWDTSVVHLPINKLDDLFHNSDKANLITSLTLNELLQLAGKPTTSESTEDDVRVRNNAIYLCNMIINDCNSEYCITVNIPKEKYVDSHLLDYCSKHDYALYTYDRALAIRAKSFRVDVTYFNHIYTSNYNPVINGKNMILDMDLSFGRVSAADIIDVAMQIGGGKFILTRQFVENLEVMKSNSSVMALICFFLFDRKNEYSLYLDEEESAEDIVDIAKKYNATILSCDINNCFQYKTTFNNNYKLVLPERNRTLIGQIIEKNGLDENVAEKSTENSSTSSNSVVEDTTLSMNDYVKPAYEKDNYEYCTIPYFSQKKNCILTRKVDLNSKIWVLDNHDEEIHSKFPSPISICKGYTVIHCINTFKDVFYINVYTVVKRDNKFYGKLQYSKEFTKNSFGNIISKYRNYAERTTLIT